MSKVLRVRLPQSRVDALDAAAGDGSRSAVVTAILDRRARREQNPVEEEPQAAVTFRASDEQLERWQAAAADAGLTMIEWIRDAIERSVTRRRKPT